ncbi:mycofactocin biosynthesis chaperone MftB [Flexivirga oryzae]|uniref:Putative mycofactocin binding protein MftB n=1 Tax=Flexivirga oryzae TaxID=1794944 RepID=A0A839N8K0_9MICO|nr:mycofactocin biosynthesis chaperone MftB [Flexivirga oryzae]MBB2891535.1 putative mycofactocin binding protein MftB [Flexivirga oryzae]
MLDQAWALNDSVALRPEPFGALAYDFTTRRLSFLKDPALVDVVRQLREHDGVTETLDAVGVPRSERPRFRAALQRLADQQMIVPRSPQ